MASAAQTRPLTFQQLLFTLQTFWADRGCVLQQPYDVEVGAGTMSPDTFLRVLGPKARPHRLRAALAPPRRRPLRRKPQPPLPPHPVPGHPQTTPGQRPGALPRVARRPRHRPPPARHQVRGRQLGVARRRRLGRRLAGHARRPRDHPVHLLPAVRRHGPRPHLRRDHLRPRAHRRLPPGCRLHLRHRLGRRTRRRKSHHLRRHAPARRTAVLRLRLRLRRRRLALEAPRAL